VDLFVIQFLFFVIFFLNFVLLQFDR
jgi:hypothetical protein